MKPRVLLLAAGVLAFASGSAFAQTTASAEPVTTELHQTAAATTVDTQPDPQAQPPVEAAATEAPRAAPDRCAAWRRPERAGLEFVLVPLDWFRSGLSALRRGITC